MNPEFMSKIEVYENSGNKSLIVCSDAKKDDFSHAICQAHTYHDARRMITKLMLRFCSNMP